MTLTDVGLFSQLLRSYGAGDMLEFGTLLTNLIHFVYLHHLAKSRVA